MQQAVIQSDPLPDLNDILPFGLEDQTCLEEIATVLKKHGRLNRFGVTLLHQHFPVGDDEVMLETNDPVSRTLEMRPCSRAELENKEATVTSWRLDSGKPQMACVCVKMGDDHQHHSRG
ncbi:MAG: hypothetical protein ACYC1Y_00200 [Minisyncoccota bacterium]